MKALKYVSNWWIHTSANRYKEHGSTLFYRNETEKSLGLLNKALQFNPDLTEAYNIRGRARYRLGDYQGAIDDYSIVLRSEKHSAEIYLNRALAHYANGALDDALGDLNMAIFLNARLAYAFNLRGMVDELQGNLNGAIADYTQAIRLNPRIDMAYTNRGSIRAHRGDLYGAIADYQVYLELGGGRRHGDQSRVEADISTLKGQIEQASTS
jgi:tetratricopeptide (TPR) repeat protein